ncbi:hypothetical protein [Ruminococcus sp.]|uniref:hypothetical protein n=1 Tax=Ruminococcus sp. TaxID=41978 RepID=UPI002582B0F3|nr:hypothetical protein [Ruminococcus sp.]MCR5021430.1 hypothetical protein [Ruminococcus sp.]
MDFDNDDSKVAGTVGALIGAALAIGLWCLIGLLGRIAFIGGIAICLGSLGGYYLLGKGMSKTGLIISLVIIVLAVYLATRLNYAISLYRAFDGEVSFGKCYSSVIKLLAAYGEKGSFYKDLFFGYLITIGGGVVLMAKMR